MARRRDISHEEIVKQFSLPERQSKIDTLLKQDGQAYCLCRSSDSSRFMIACDACEEWYHGDCIAISEKEAKLIKQYVCIRCHEEDPTLITRWKTKREDNYTDKEEHRSRKRKDRSENKIDKKKKKCGDCMGCYRTEDCGRCDVCTRKFKHSRQKERCKQRICVNYGGSHNRRKRRDSTSDNEPNTATHLMTDYPRQCYGPGCSNSARYGSKYCSDVCGIRLATNRICQVLPQRIQEWALSPCIAEEKNIKALDQVRKQQLEVRQILQELDKRHGELDLIIDRAKNASIVPNQETDNDDDTEISTYCITCGHEIHSKTAIKHMEKCFNKYESQATFGSIFKTKIEGNFCCKNTRSSPIYQSL
ncbi:CXXC-type zinc finger protein 1-like [Agrilus planipennis]|uniref:CXXC-type zinc finger protein 1 n=1 Tax=Agrilus planipennis TaxID=224129 RepID=A0A7F5REE2_AGRPL|nr:CXXC-type zinc finger protein 1-like [Agrilus planipennis]